MRNLFETHQLFIRARYIRNFCKMYPEEDHNEVLKITGNLSTYDRGFKSIGPVYAESCDGSKKFYNPNSAKYQAWYISSDNYSHIYKAKRDAENEPLPLKKRYAKIIFRKKCL